MFLPILTVPMLADVGGHVKTTAVRKAAIIGDNRDNGRYGQTRADAALAV
jgi:hypothetical protein